MADTHILLTEEADTMADTHIPLTEEADTMADTHIPLTEEARRGKTTALVWRLQWITTLSPPKRLGTAPVPPADGGAPAYVPGFQVEAAQSFTRGRSRVR